MYLRNLILRRNIKLVRLADIIINDLNIKRNDIVMVHTSLLNINLIDSRPEDLIYLLKMIVGVRGTILMPTFSENHFHSPNYKLINNNRNASDRYDLINELFRQMPDTIQSCIPSESFAVWGKMAKEIAEDAYISDNIFDKNKFFYKLFLIKAKIIGLGVSLTDLSFLIHNISDIINYKSKGEISKFFEEGELKTFKKRGIPFLYIDAEKFYNKNLVLSKQRIPE